MIHSISKRIIAVFMVSILLCCMGMASFAASTSASVRVTVADGSEELALTAEKIKALDRDGDGIVTVNEVLYMAHEDEFTGGAAAGYAVSEDAEPQILTLWGVEDKKVAVYHNNHRVTSLNEACRDGDTVYAFVYTDQASLSDVYCYFDTELTKVNNGQDVTMTLHRVSYDAQGTETVEPLAGVAVTFNGDETEYVTDENGAFTFRANSTGILTVSASFAVGAEPYVTPVYMLVVNGPRTGDNAPILSYAFVAVFSLGVVIALATNKPRRTA